MQDIDGEILCGEVDPILLVFTSNRNFISVSQFTLLANTRKGNKPDFHGAAKPEEAKQLYDYFVSKVQDLYSAERVKNGLFQAMMEVGLVNDGPVGVDYRSGNTTVLSNAWYRKRWADVWQVTLEIETNPPKRDKNVEYATTATGGNSAIPNGTAGSLPQELLN